jgi:hypothetical protein
VVREKQPEFQWRTNSSWQCSSTPFGSAQGFLSKNNVTTLEHPPYSPDLASSNSYLFPRLKSALKGQPFCFATDITKNVTEELKMLSQNGFQECLLQLHSCW